MTSKFQLPALLLRISIAVSYLWFVADRLGLLGVPGSPLVGWGNWKIFLEYAGQTMSFLPDICIPPLAIIATGGEFVVGSLLLLGLFTRIAALSSSILSLLFAVSMAVSFGIQSPLGYSVFTLSAASFLLATIPEFRWSLDRLREEREIKKR